MYDGQGIRIHCSVLDHKCLHWYKLEKTQQISEKKPFPIDFSDPLKDALDGVQIHMTGQPSFNKDFYDELVGCMNNIDPRYEN